MNLNPKIKPAQIQYLKKAGRYLLYLAGGGLVFSLIFFLLVYLGAFGSIPDKEELTNIQNRVASEIYASDGELLGKYYLENRSQIAFEEISPRFIEALVATEDARFYEHSGVDTRSLMRVAFKSVLLSNESSGGGSTISQQLVKNLFPRKSYAVLSLPINKIREMIIAKRLEKVYSKEEILGLYLNTVSFGENVFGIEVAAQRFFSTSPDKLNTEQSATLVGMLQATTLYNPRLYPERSLTRRNVVLSQMEKYGYMTETEKDSLQKLPLDLKYKFVSEADMPGAYFRQELARQLKEYFRKHPRPDGEAWDLFTDGLKIHTTIDARMQKYAEKAVDDHMSKLQSTFNKHWSKRTLWEDNDPVIVREMQNTRRYQSLKAAGKSEEEIKKVFTTAIEMNLPGTDGKMISKTISPLDSVKYMNSFLHAGFLAMEPQSGYIKAWVGGVDYKHFQFDHVTSRRQVGSTFKPFIYASAIENGIEPCEYIPNELTVYEDYDEWTPGNSDEDYNGYYSLQGGLTHSVNTVSATLMMKVGVEEAATFAEKMGFEATIPHEPSLVLGTADLSLMEMVGAYSAFANRGTRVKPVFLLRIEDKDGNLIADFSRDIERTKVMNAQTADMMIKMLCSVVDSGTAMRLRRTYGLTSQIGGKTGTTQDQTDGWFMGITPHLVAGAWVGGDHRQVRFRSLSLGQGANTALPIYAKFMQQVYKDRKYRHTRSARFPEPNRQVMENLECPMFTMTLDDGRRERINELIQLLIERQKRKRENFNNNSGGNKWDFLFNKKKRKRNRNNYREGEL